MQLRLGILMSLVAVAGCAHHQSETKVAAAPAPAPAPAPHKLVINPTVKRVVATEKGLAITEKIQFDFDKANILPASDSLLDEVATVLRENPHVQLVQVEGYTSSEGKEEHNRLLSQQRAESVRDWLVKHGIPAERLAAKGFGPDQPIADNGTEDGREKNRRVEFAILKETEPAAAAGGAAAAQPTP